eukprot:6681130-Pyramimonas_sp.AAC.1
MHCRAVGGAPLAGWSARSVRRVFRADAYGTRSGGAMLKSPWRSAAVPPVSQKPMSGRCQHGFAILTSGRWSAPSHR